MISLLILQFLYLLCEPGRLYCHTNAAEILTNLILKHFIELILGLQNYRKIVMLIYILFLPSIVTIVLLLRTNKVSVAMGCLEIRFCKL